MYSETIRTISKKRSRTIENLERLGVKVDTTEQDHPKRIFIPGEVPSSKNSRQIIIKGGKYRSIASDFCQKYIKSTRILYSMAEPVFSRMIPYTPPLCIGFQFVRKTNRIFDYTNIAQIVQDMMTQSNWIKDDRMSELLPVFFPYTKDKENPGVWISIEDNGIFQDHEF